MRTFGNAVPNALSLSRIPAALGFLLVYSTSSAAAFTSAVLICFFALGTDILDGYLARKWRVQSLLGYFLDGLGDKSFYAAFLIVVARERPAEAIGAWLLIVREIFLYALRALDPQQTQNIARLRPLSVIHALFIRLYFMGFLCAGAFTVENLGIPPLVDALFFSKYIAIIVGYAGIVALMHRDH